MLYDLGRCYLNGIGTKRDETLAFQHFKQAEEKGCYNEQLYSSLGKCYEYGIGTPQDFSTAFEYYTKCKYDIYSNVRRAVLLYNGQGVVQNYEEATAILLKLVDQHCAIGSDGAEILAKCYRFGRGVPQDNEKAEYWQSDAYEANKKIDEIKNG